MPHLPETKYSSNRNSPFWLLLDQNGKKTLILSEISAHQDVRKTLEKSSTTRISAPESKAVVDSFFSKPWTTWAEGDAEVDANSTFGEASDPSVLANRNRLVFLARKYARHCYSKEEDARLEILTEKVRAMLPRVTKNDFQRVAEIANEFSRIHEENQKLRDKLKLDSK